MEEKELIPSKIDVIFLLRIWLRYARRFWALALVTAILGACLLGFMGYRAYTPSYEASVSFTVKVSNPLYGSINAYNSTARSVPHGCFSINLVICRNNDSYSKNNDGFKQKHSSRPNASSNAKNDEYNDASYDYIYVHNCTYSSGRTFILSS